MRTRSAIAPEPPPQTSSTPDVWPLVISDLDAIDAPLWLRQKLAEDMRSRDEFGREKYGTPLRVDNKRNAGNDAYQEALDLCVYARQRAEQTHLPFWAAVSGQAIGMAAAIKYQMCLEESTAAETEP